jgi:hypothetical protein
MVPAVAVQNADTPFDHISPAIFVNKTATSTIAVSAKAGGIVCPEVVAFSAMP